MLKINVVSVKTVKVRMDGDDNGYFTAKMRVIPLSEAGDLSDLALVNSSLQDENGEWRGDAISDIDITGADGKPLTGVELTKFVADYPETSAALAGAYLDNFRNRHLRANTEQPNKVR